MEIASTVNVESHLDQPVAIEETAVSEKRRYNIEKNRRYAMVTNMRKFLAYNFLYYNMLWATAIVSILYFNNYFLKLELSDTVIVTLLTTATLNFNGMMYVILRNIYPKEVE